MKRKKKGKTYAQLKTALDRVFSEWVRRSAADSEGFVRCVTCTGSLPWVRMQAGHFVSRVHLATRWDERNVHPQCMADNVWKRGSPAEFSVYLTTKYGPNILQELVDLKHSTVKFTRADLQAKIQEYQERLAQLN